MAESPKMTAAEARTFDGYSEANALLILMTLKCDCQPYVDTFTYNRWRAQGFQVKKGEHGIALPIRIPYEKEDAETHEKKIVTRPGTSYVFCRHQVSPIQEN